MDIAALILAVVALVLALGARSRAAKAQTRTEEVLREALRRADGAAKMVQTDSKNLRLVVAALAAGEPLTRERVLEGQLYSEVDARKAQELVEKGEVRLLDVRTPQETAEGIIPGALLIPLDDLKARVSEVPRDGRPTLVYCAVGARSATACEFLSEQGVPKLMNLAGGIGAWQGPRGKPA